MEYIPRKYQYIATRFGYELDFAMLMIDMGLGKTVATLTLAKMLIYRCEVVKPLIIAPKLVARHTWPEEIKKWDHLKKLSISVIAGTEPERLEALNRVTDLYIISRDNIIWLENHLKVKKWNFDFVIIDESSSFKNPKAKRFKALKRVLPRITRLIQLTGTPAPNGLMDLWSQMYLIDQGKRLKKFVETYRGLYFHKGHNGYGWEINRGCDELIFDQIKDVCLSMKASDWIQLPKRQDIIKEIELDDYTEYHQFRRDKILELPEGMITAFNAGSLYTKLLQYANGAIYDADGKYHIVHDLKLDALEEAVEELQGKSVIIFYSFKSDTERIKARIPGIVQLKTEKQIDDWNSKKIKIMLAHPASTGHGLNLQFGGNYIFWYGIPASMESYWQAIRRIERPGQPAPTVFNVHFMIKGTPEAKVYRGLMDKTFSQNKLLNALKYEE